MFQLSAMEAAGTEEDVLHQTHANARQATQGKIVKGVNYVLKKFCKNSNIIFNFNIDNFNNPFYIYNILAICSPPCLNGGKCIRPPNTCRCLASFTGKYCELKSHRKKKMKQRTNQNKPNLSSENGHRSRVNKVKRKKQKKRSKWKTKVMRAIENSVNVKTSYRVP